MRAIIAGASGLTGSLILKEVLADSDFSEVRIFVRKPTGINNPKLKEFISPLKDLSPFDSEITGDVLFNALGTTIKQAGSKEEQRRIDRDLPVNFARIASKNGVKVMLNVSSAGANIKGGFYLKTKAEMELGTEEYFPGAVFHFRPGFLVGKRKEFRLAEKLFFGVVKIIDPLLSGPAKKYRSMPSDKLAKAMVKLSKNPPGETKVLHFTEIMELI